MTEKLLSTPTAAVIFGGGGDLSWRKLLPALYNLFLDGWLPEDFAILGVDRIDQNDAAYQQHVRKGIDSFSRRGKSTDADWERFAKHVSYLRADITTAPSYAELAQRLAALEKQWKAKPNFVFYLATAPTLVQTIAQQLQGAKLSQEKSRARLVVEKPFGRDLASAAALNRALTDIFDERQIYRIDHYLGKETVQNLLAFRFANSLFEPIWKRNYIDNVQITVAEEVGVENRGGYYDHAGALRDMVQNHLMQILCLIAMEPPVSFDADEVRNKKSDVLHALRPIAKDQVPQFAVRGQYDEGAIDGKPVPAYRSEPSVDPNSNTETYAALNMFVDNWRWQDVPFYLRTGKRLAGRVSEAIVQFKPVPHRSFPFVALKDWPPNRLTIRVQPDEGVFLSVQAKVPGPTMRMKPIEMHFTYKEVFKAPAPEAYETLLLDVIRGDATLFMRADQVEAAWTAVMPVLEYWAAKAPADFPNYAAGSWGPGAADDMLAREGRTWLPMSIELACAD
jgi:glucose-6-phosphate 1-dehydrogenase